MIGEALNALNSGPHTIKGAVVDVRKAKEAAKSIAKVANKSLPGKEESTGTYKNTLTFEIRDVPEGVTQEALIAFYSKYGRVEECRLRKGKTGIPFAYVSFSAIDELNSAMDDRPHIIDGKPLQIQSRDHSTRISLFVGCLPENFTEETLREEFSKYGKPVYWALKNGGQFGQSGPYGIVKYSTDKEALNALNNGSNANLHFKPLISAQETPFEEIDSIKSPTNVTGDHTASKVSQPSTFNKNLKLRKYYITLRNSWMNQKASKSKIVEDQKDSKAPTLYENDSMDSRPSVTEDQKPSKSPIFNKDLNLRKYYISVSDLSINTTPESLREFYSQFGEIAYCDILFPGETQQFGSVAFLKEEAMDRALNSLPHCIDGKDTDNVGPGVLDKKQLTLQVLDLSPKTTAKSLRKFYSRFGRVNGCCVKMADRKIGRIGKVTFADQKDMHRALDAQPHVIDGSEVFLQYATFDLDLWITDVPESVTEEELIAFYSKYGQLRECRLLKGRTGIPDAFVSYSAVDEVNRAIDDRPHIINGKPLRIRTIEGSESFKINVSLVVGSLPENVTEETLRDEFSKYGKLVSWKLRNDGQFNQSGPYGIVAYGSEEEALNALNNGPHTIEGAVVDVRKAKEVLKSLSKEKSCN
ncbi:RNA recognition motif domain-containing protein [Ditylenchus destructor]|nr:RNA recognition motif domain-containing protein [Ditylenchus destructor]